MDKNLKPQSLYQISNNIQFGINYKKEFYFAQIKPYYNKHVFLVHLTVIISTKPVSVFKIKRYI
jgi:hypothetical protein